MLTPSVTKQNVTKTLRGAEWNIIEEVIHQFEKTSWE